MENTAHRAILEELIRNPDESDIVEFKSNWQKPDDIGEYISAMANSTLLRGRNRAYDLANRRKLIQNVGAPRGPGARWQICD